MLQRLKDLFEGKRVRISHPDRRIATAEGRCKTVHPIKGSENNFDLELTNGHRYGFIPETVTEFSVEGKIGNLIVGHRKIELE